MSIKKKAKSPFILNPSLRVKGFRKHHQEKKLKFIQLAREREARGQGKARQKPSPGQMMKLGWETRESQAEAQDKGKARQKPSPGQMIKFGLMMKIGFTQLGGESLVEARDKGKVEKQSLRQMRKLSQGRKQLKIPKCNDAENNSWDSDHRPIKERSQQFKHDRTLEDSFNDGSVSSVDEAKLRTEAGLGDSIPGRKLMKKHGSYWEADLCCSESTNVIQLAMESSEWGKKKKYTNDEEAPLTKNPQVEASYKFGPRNAPPGKIKKALAFSVVVQDPVKKAKELFKPTFHKQSTIGGIVSQASSKPFDFMELVDGDPVKAKPKPKPHPIKWKVSTSELGIVTQDWSKRIAKESVHSTRSKKL